MSKQVGIYIHIPFCERKCLYCDFCSYEGTTAAHRVAYVDALCREITAYAPRLVGYEADTVYIGGGTPSMLTCEETKRILSTLRSVVPFSAHAEVTSEVNPATADAEKLRAWQRMGINRLSIGVQSFQDAELRALGRLHTADEAEAFIRTARDVGFDNLSIDLMYGIPGETPESFRNTLDRAVTLSPDHISAYSLKVEEGTPFARMREQLTLPDEDTEVSLYEMCVSVLGGAGYRHYEISNYARAGYESRHNLRYWQMRDYIGFGLAAYSCFEGKRFGRDRDMDAYLSRDFRVDMGVKAEPMDVELETVMLGLRLADGIREEDFRQRFGYGFWEKYGERMQPFVTHGLAVHDGEKTYLTDSGMYVSLGILAEICE